MFCLHLRDLNPQILILPFTGFANTVPVLDVLWLDYQGLSTAQIAVMPVPIIQ